MSDQLILDLEAGRAARDAGIALVIEHKREEVARAADLILWVARRYPTFTPDTVWCHIDWDCPATAMSSAFSILARRKQIVKTGQFTQSARPNQHGTAIFYWRQA